MPEPQPLHRIVELDVDAEVAGVQLQLMQKTHVARLKFPAPATMEIWVTDQFGDPVFMVVAEPSGSLAGELRRLPPQLRQVAGEGRDFR